MVEFATFLFVAKIAATDEFYVPGSLLGYIGRVKGALMTKCRIWSIWDEAVDDTSWPGYKPFLVWEHIYKEFKRKIYKRIRSTGDCLRKKLKPATHGRLSQMLKGKLSSTSPSTIAEAPFIAVDFNSAGRSGEAALASWDSCYYHHGE